MFEKRNKLNKNIDTYTDIKNIIISAYEAFLRRTPLEKEVLYWFEQIINSKITLKQFFSAVANSDEIKNLGLSTDLYFDSMLNKLYKLLTDNMGVRPLDIKQTGEIKKIRTCESLVSDRDIAMLRYVLFSDNSIKNFIEKSKDTQKIIYLHIPKCAGNSVMKYFEYALGGDNLLKFNFNGFLFDNEKWIDECKSLFSHVKFITGAHIDINACEKIPGNNNLIITFIREPKSRILDSYYYFKSHKLSYIASLPKKRQDSIVLSNAKTHNLINFLKSKNSYTINTIDNTITRCLTGFFIKDNYYDRTVDGNTVNNNLHDTMMIDKLHENPEKTLDIALKNLDKIEIIGILEKFDPSLKLFSKILKTKEPQMNNYKENITENNFSVSSNFEKIEEEPLTEEIEKELKRLTNLDKIVYEYALEKFNNMTLN